MHVETQMDRVKAIRTHRITGAVTLEDFRNLLEAVYNSAQFDASMHSLWDVREADFTGVTAQDIRSFGEFVRKNWVETRKNKAAIVVSSLADFGITRMYEMVLGPMATGKVMVFRNLKTAWDWIEGRIDTAAAQPVGQTVPPQSRAPLS